jgi:hypothetical protein
MTARTTTPASTPLHRVRAPDSRFSDERENEPARRIALDDAGRDVGQPLARELPVGVPGLAVLGGVLPRDAGRLGEAHQRDDHAEQQQGRRLRPGQRQRRNGQAARHGADLGDGDEPERREQQGAGRAEEGPREQWADPSSEQDEHHDRHADGHRGRVPGRRVPDGLPRREERAGLIGVHLEQRRHLRQEDEQTGGDGERGDDRLAHQIGDEAPSQQADEQPDRTDDECQQRRQRDVLVGARGGERGQGAEGEQARQRHGPGLQVARRADQPGRDGGGDRRVETGDDRKAGQLRVGQRLRDEHQGDGDGGDQVAAGGRRQAAGEQLSGRAHRTSRGDGVPPSRPGDVRRS